MKRSKASASELAGFKPQVLLAILDPANIEIQQSAEILYRELRMRGLSVLFDDVHGTAGETAQAILNLSEKSLQGGEVELLLPRLDRRRMVSLEDAVEKTVEWLNDLV